MNVNVGIWDKLSKLVLVLCFVASLLFVCKKYLPLIQDNQRYRKQILSLDAQLVEQEQLTRRLRSEINSLENNHDTVERLARKTLALARTNEMVVRFVPARKDQEKRQP